MSISSYEDLLIKTYSLNPFIKIESVKLSALSQTGCFLSYIKISENKIKIINLSTKKKIINIPVNQEVIKMRFSNNNVFSYSTSNKITMYDVSDNLTLIAEYVIPKKIKSYNIVNDYVLIQTQNKVFVYKNNESHYFRKITADFFITANYLVHCNNFKELQLYNLHTLTECGTINITKKYDGAETNSTLDKLFLFSNSNANIISIDLKSKNYQVLQGLDNSVVIHKLKSTGLQVYVIAHKINTLYSVYTYMYVLGEFRLKNNSVMTVNKCYNSEGTTTGSMLLINSDNIVRIYKLI